MRRALGLVGLALLLGGCAAPAWVPVVGRPKPPPPRITEPVVPRGEERAPRRPPADGDFVIDRVIAVVNNDAITLGELQENIIAVRQESGGRATAGDEEMGRRLLARLIETRLQLQEADRERITAEDAEVAAELEERMRKLGVTSQEEIEVLLRRQGLSIDSVRRRLHDAIRVSKVVRRKVALRVSVTDAEIDRYLDDNRAKLETGLPYRARHILVAPASPTDGAWEEARIRAEMLREELAAGGDFAALARAHSQDASARDGGDLGQLKRGELAEEIEATILALEPGEVSRPHQSALGYHLFRLESKDTLDGDGRERARQQIRDILFRQKYEARFEAWMEELRERAIIEVRM
jgi:peptidyl-prolyl cis-trans isomerase SurA